MLSGKNKAIILIIVVLAAVAVLLIPLQEKAVETPVITEQSTESQVQSFASIKPSQNPYQDYLAARRENKPIILKFYARW